MEVKNKFGTVYEIKPGANLAGVDLAGVDLVGVDLAGANLTGSNLTKTNLAGADLTNATLAWAKLAGVDLTGAKLTGANLAETNLTGANLAYAKLTDAKLEWANLAEANLTGVKLTNAKLAWANLTETNLTGANLTGVKLAGANLTETNLTDANLAEANLTGAVLTGAKLTDANLTGTQGLVKQMGVEVGNFYWKRFGEGLINNGYQFKVGINKLREGEVFADDERKLCTYPGFHFASRSWCAVNYPNRPLEAKIRIPEGAKINEPWATDGKASADMIEILQVFDVKTGEDVTEKLNKEGLMICKQRSKEVIDTVVRVTLVVLMLCIFWVFLFYGICAEQDRRERQKSNRQWLHERVLNEYNVKNPPMQEKEILKAMEAAQKGGK
jgi:uncharacterized protein YjbI with pentapeptide repeats